VRKRNWIQGHSHTDDSGRLITSSSEVTNLVEKVKTLATKEKSGEFKSQQERDQLSATLKNEEHHGQTQAISSIASWKEGFEDESLYKKRKTHEIAHNTEETFSQQFFNFMRKNP
jgi:phosphoenolpyruvate carboxylase